MTSPFETNTESGDKQGLGAISKKYWNEQILVYGKRIGEKIISFRSETSFTPRTEGVLELEKNFRRGISTYLSELFQSLVDRRSPDGEKSKVILVYEDEKEERYFGQEIKNKEKVVQLKLVNYYQPWNPGYLTEKRSRSKPGDLAYHGEGTKNSFDFILAYFGFKIQTSSKTFLHGSEKIIPWTSSPYFDEGMSGDPVMHFDTIFNENLVEETPGNKMPVCETVTIIDFRNPNPIAEIGELQPESDKTETEDKTRNFDSETLLSDFENLGKETFLYANPLYPNSIYRGENGKKIRI